MSDLVCFLLLALARPPAADHAPQARQPQNAPSAGEVRRVAPAELDLDHHGPRPDYFAELSLGVSPGAGVVLPPPPPGEPPAAVRGLYVNAWAFGSSRFYDLVRLADSTEVNALVIDVKDDTGYLTYRSNVPTAIAIGANDRIRAADVRARLALLQERGIHPIARIVVAKDPLLAVRKPSWAVRHREGGFWEDRIGSRWVDAHRDSVWIYAADIAAEAVMLGFQEIQFDYLRFPDEPRWMLDRAIFSGRREGESQRAAIRRNVALMRQRTASLGVPFTLDIFGLTTSADGDLGIGQVWEDLVPLADVVLPMVYPSHYRRGAYGIAHPNAEPYATVRRALEDGLRKNASLPGAARIRPFFQAFTIYRVRYAAAQIRAQIRAAEELGIGEWVLWNPRSVYSAEALRPGGTVHPVVATSPNSDATAR
ncbi:MAG TPA: putative glycoside hydrolase [Gemmatimonadales bacterium]